MSELRVFISSTFRDLQEEREHLVKKIFPEIRSLCRERGITFTEVDLRWGLTEENQVLGQIIRTCLEEIDRCRPYFIGITGERYGYVPELTDIYKDSELLKQYGWIEDAVMEGASIIDMEFRHAALNDPAASVDTARFFFRRHRRSLDSDGSDSEDARLLDDLKNRVRDAKMSVEEFRDPTSLGEMIYDEMIEIIQRDFAESRALTELEKEQASHRAFAASRRRSYIPNPMYLKRLNEYAQSQDPPLILYAESGSGKSSLVAFWAEAYRRKYPGTLVVEHYVGIGAGETDHLAVIRHIMSEIKVHLGREDEIPSKPEVLEAEFANWLGFLKDKPAVLVIDGINQLQGRARSLSWLPRQFPTNIRLVVSSTVEETLMALRERGWTQLGMQPMSEKEREALVVRFLSEYRKALSAEQIARIAGDQKSSHPLFLRTLLEELRLHGTHEHLDRTLDYYLETTGTQDLFQKVLERLESDYSSREIRDVMSLLYCATGGLSETELAEVTGFARSKLATLVLGLDYHLVRNDGQLTFFHDYLRNAVEKRYLADASKKKNIHILLADYFQNMSRKWRLDAQEAGITRSSLVETWRSVTSKRATSELVVQLLEAGEWDRMMKTLPLISVFMAMYHQEMKYEYLSLWERLRRQGTDPGPALSDVLTGYSNSAPPYEEHAQVLDLAADLYERLGLWDHAAGMLAKLFEVAVDAKDRRREGRARSGLGWMYTLQGRYDEALQELNHALTIAEELDDRRGIATAVGNIGRIYSNRGDYARALECFQRNLVISEELGDRHDIARAVGYLGGIYFYHGEFDMALEYFQRNAAISEGLGDRRSIASAVGNMGGIYSNRGDYDRALECYQQTLAISEELGDRRSLATVGLNMGAIYSLRGKYERALECYQRTLAISEELGDRRSLAYAHSNMGIVYIDRGEHELALACFQRDLAIHEELGDRRSIATAFGNMGTVHAGRGEFGRALQCLTQAANEHKAIGFLHGYASWLSEIAQTLLEVLATTNLMPEYLPGIVSSAEPEKCNSETWREMALQFTHRDAEECLAVSGEISNPDTMFAANICLARIEAYDGNIDVARKHLNGMLNEADEEGRANLHYWLCRIERSGDKGDAVEDVEMNCRTALRLYESIIEDKPKHEYLRRVEELRECT